MSYVVPAPLIYQQLANAGGVANISPDLGVVIVGPCYNVVEYDGSSSASLTLTAALNSSGEAGSITDNTVNNTFTLPSQKVGQVLDGDSLKVYVNNAVVETLATKVIANPTSNFLDILEVTSSASALAADPVLSGVTNAAKLVVGDHVSVTGIGTAGATVNTTVTAISGTNVTIAFTPVTTANSATLTKLPVSNLNSVSSTLRVEKGDAIVVSYKTSGNVAKTFSSTVLDVISSDNIISGLDLSDMAPSDVPTNAEVAIQVKKNYNNLLLSSGNYDSSDTAAEGTLVILPKPTVAYGTILTGQVHIEYRALRQDLLNTVVTLSDPADIKGVLGVRTERNPLALGVLLALANTTSEVYAVSVSEDTLEGYVGALELLENQKKYSIVPLTQEVSIVTAIQQHVDQMSVPEKASWRMGLLSTAIPSAMEVGVWNANLVNANGGNNSIVNTNGHFILTASNATFMSDGVTPGDVVVITAGSGSTNPVGNHQVIRVISNQQIEVQAGSTAAGISYYITRKLSKAQQAAHVAGVSNTFKDSRVVHCPNVAGVELDGVVKYLPGYYFMCGIGGLIAGLPAQAGLTNVALAGFADVKYSNFYFTRAQMDVMAAAGTLLVVQETQGSIPYVRHELTTDMSVLQYREIQQVKNIDYLSYFYYDILKNFIGKWNITPDSLNTLRQSINAGSSLLVGRKLPKIGAPLLSATIKTLKQDSANKDNVICELLVEIGVPMNYITLYLIV